MKETSAKEEWKSFGKEMGKSFKNLGKSLIKTIKVSSTKLDDKIEGTKTNTKSTKLKESWSTTGHSFTDSGKHFTNAIKKTFTKTTKKS